MQNAISLHTLDIMVLGSDFCFIFCQPYMQVGKDKDLGFDPCCVTYQDDKYLCIGGSSRKVIMRFFCALMRAVEREEETHSKSEFTSWWELELSLNSSGLLVGSWLFCM